jgi:hypothetical protein
LALAGVPPLLQAIVARLRVLRLVRCAILFPGTHAESTSAHGFTWGEFEEAGMTDQAVRVVRSGPVTTVFLHRPARRNAVDGPTAAQLAAAFRAFDADTGAAVAVLHGEGGVFCRAMDMTPKAWTRPPRWHRNSRTGTCQTGWNVRRCERRLLCPPVTQWWVVAG